MHNVYFTFIHEEERQVTSEETILNYVEVIPRIGETIIVGKSEQSSASVNDDEVLKNKDVYKYEGGLVINVVHNIIECSNTDKHRIDVFVKKQIKGGKL